MCSPVQKETDIIDPYVVVSVSGVRKDVSKRFKTRTVSNNGFHPVWDETFTFPIRRPDHAILVIQARPRSRLSVCLFFVFFFWIDCLIVCVVLWSSRLGGG